MAAGLAIGASVTWGTEPIAPWRSGVKVHPLTSQAGRHTIHTYYLTCPENPDGTRVLFFASTTPEGEHGDLVVLDRQTGNEQVIARGIDTEDAHRAACQQWISGGKRVAYHDVKDGRWSVHVVDLDTLADRKLAEDRQLCFGRAVDDLLPIYGCHWKPGEHRDLELLDAATGEIRTVLTIAEVEREHGAWLAKEFGGMPTSIFFPNISPDGQRVFFKMAAAGRDGAANIFKSENASHRQGLLVYELATRRPLFMAEKWAHPAWDAGSRRIIERGHFFYDLDDGGNVVRMPDLPAMSNHPSVSPDGKLFVTDGLVDTVGGPAGRWGIAVGDTRGGQFQVLHRFVNSKGATTWRKNHPHPIFSGDGKRIYFNVNETNWTQLYVAEANINP
jgi:Tol biopolymer transport system component